MDVDALIDELEKFDRREVVYPTGSPGETRLMRSAAAALRELKRERDEVVQLLREAKFYVDQEAWRQSGSDDDKELSARIDKALGGQ